jgi:hypothetical protein
MARPVTDPSPYHDRSAPHGVVDGLPQATNGTRRMLAPTCACGGSCICHLVPPGHTVRCPHCPEEKTMDQHDPQALPETEPS